MFEEIINEKPWYGRFLDFPRGLYALAGLLMIGGGHAIDFWGGFSGNVVGHFFQLIGVGLVLFELVLLLLGFFVSHRRDKTGN
jgi:uncharacterized protein YqgC (DUF456 family)